MRCGVGRATAVLTATALSACSARGPDVPGPGEYARELPAGGSALEEPTLDAWPDLSGAIGSDRTGLLEALDRSLDWFSKPSSHRFYPIAGVTHERARASVFAFRELVSRVTDPTTLAAELRRQFELRASVGWDGRGTVLFTGYYAPVFDAARERTPECRHPLYRRPADLVRDSVTGATLGRRVNGRLVPYPTRGEIERSGMLAGQELVWVCDPFEAYSIQLQGSALLRLRDGSTLPVGYAGSNGREYVSVARELVKDGKLKESELSAQRVRAWFEAHPDQFEDYFHRNPRYVFFEVKDGREWPAGSLGVRVTPLRSLATDKDVFPPGSVVLVDTQMPDPDGGARRVRRFMVDQDTGGAIRAAGRADIYYGIGAAAGARAGRQYSQGRLFYLLLKPGLEHEWLARMAAPR